MTDKPASGRALAGKIIDGMASLVLTTNNTVLTSKD